MVEKIMHFQAMNQGIKAVKIISRPKWDNDPWFLTVELPDGTPAYVYYSNTLRYKISKYLRETKTEDVYGINLYPHGHKLGVVTWEIVRPSTTLPPRFLLKDEN